MAKIDIISGFLGAGKTTLIKKLVAEAFSGEQLVIIENEFGQIAIDGGFLKESGVNITEMNSGCICCSLVGDFSKSLQEVEKNYAPDRIIIEPSGVGKLSDVIKAVQELDSPSLVLNSAVAVVDAKKCRVYMKNFGEFYNNQLENATAVVLSRTDGLSHEKLHEVLELIRGKNPSANIITTPWNDLDAHAIVKAMEVKEIVKEQMEELLGEEKHHHEECCEHHHHHEHSCEHHDHKEHHHHHEEGCEHHHHHGEECECGCGHHHHDADEVFSSWGVQTAGIFTREKLEHILSSLESGEFGTVLRAKGIVPSADGEWLHFDYVPGEFQVREGTAEISGIVCVIGSELNENSLKELFS